MWASLDDWLLHRVLAYLDEDDLYRLWVFAEEHALDRLCDHVTLSSDHAPLCTTRALHVAMASACWTASTDTQHILNEIQQHVRSHHEHEDRESAMCSVASPGSVPEFVMYKAAQQGNLESVIWLHHVAQYDPSEALRIAARANHCEIVAWLLDNASTALWTTEGCSIQTIHHNRDEPALGVWAWDVMFHDEVVDSSVLTTKWGFADIGPSGNTEHRVVDLAAIHGDLAGVQQLLAHPTFTDAFTSHAVEGAAQTGHLHVLEWLFTSRPDVFEGANILHYAAMSGQLAVVQDAVAHEFVAEAIDLTFGVVVRNGHLHVLRWLVEEAFPTTAVLHVNDSLLNLACQYCHLPIVQWFVEEKGYAITQRHLTHAATGGQFDVFQWVVARLVMTSEGACVLRPIYLKQAARGGNLDLVRWLVEEHGLWDPEAIVRATRSTNLDAVEYLYSQTVARGERLPAPRHRTYSASICEGHFEILTWLLNHEQLDANYFNKKGFDFLKRLETNVAVQQQQLGWSDFVPTSEYWPRTHATMARFRRLLQLVILKHDPAFLRTIEWLPAWAVQHGPIETLERLFQIHHQNILSSKTFRLLLRTSVDAEKVKWFLTKSTLLFSTRVVQWAVKYDKRRFLVWLFHDFLPVYQTDAGSEFKADLRFRCIQTALWSANKYARDEIARLTPEK